MVEIREKFLVALPRHCAIPNANCARTAEECGRSAAPDSDKSLDRALRPAWRGLLRRAVEACALQRRSHRAVLRDSQIVIWFVNRCWQGNGPKPI